MCRVCICTSLTCKMCILRTNYFFSKRIFVFLANGICQLCSAIQQGQIEMRKVWFIILKVHRQRSCCDQLIWATESISDAVQPVPKREQVTLHNRFKWLIKLWVTHKLNKIRPESQCRWNAGIEPRPFDIVI